MSSSKRESAANDQDGKASAPVWYLKWIARTYGWAMLAEYHRLGKQHDRDIIEFGLKEANRRFRKNMKRTILPILTVRLPTSLLIRFYAILPREARDLYHDLIT